MSATFLPARVTTPPPPPRLPAPGAAWGGSVMGLSVTGSLLGIHAGAAVGAAVTLAAAAVSVVLLAGAVRAPRFGDIPGWSMMTMGLLSLGSASDTTLGLAGVHTVTWVLGSVAAVAVLLAQSWRFLRGRVPAVFPGVLPLVAPMVAATNAAQLGHPLPGTVLFLLSLSTAAPAFVRVYAGPGRRPGPAVAATAWIPLGVVGQSSAAALLLTGGSVVGVGYAAVVLGVGVPAAVWAAWNHWGALRRRPAFTPSWWAATFPVGTCSLGTHLLAQATGAGWPDAVSRVLLALLCLHVAAACAGFVARVWPYRYSTSTGEWSLHRRS
jgi:tellurite resistance protein TehA-like permease